MKSLAHCLALAASLALAGCTDQAERHREVLVKLEVLQAELAKQRSEPARWAYANRSKIQAAIHAWTREQAAELKKAQALPPETEAKVAEYEALWLELLYKQRPPMRPPTFLIPPGSALPQRIAPMRTLFPLPADLLATQPSLPPAPTPAPASAPPPTPAPARPAPTELEKEYEALVRRVADAKAPVALIVERRSQLAAKYHSREFLGKLVADYAQDKYDLVVDSSDDRSHDRTVLFHTIGVTPDITEGVIRFFRSTAKP